MKENKKKNKKERDYFVPFNYVECNEDTSKLFVKRDWDMYQ